MTAQDQTPRTAAPRPVHHCETCGAEVRVISAEHGTSYYQPVAEAARQVTELRAAVEALTWTTMSEQRGKTGQYIDRAEVLALLSAGDKAEAPRKLTLKRGETFDD